MPARLRRTRRWPLVAAPGPPLQQPRVPRQNRSLPKNRPPRQSCPAPLQRLNERALPTAPIGPPLSPSLKSPPRLEHCRHRLARRCRTRPPRVLNLPDSPRDLVPVCPLPQSRHSSQSGRVPLGHPVPRGLLPSQSGCPPADYPVLPGLLPSLSGRLLPGHPVLRGLLTSPSSLGQTGRPLRPTPRRSREPRQSASHWTSARSSRRAATPVTSKAGCCTRNSRLIGHGRSARWVSGFSRAFRTTTSRR